MTLNWGACCLIRQSRYKHQMGCSLLSIAHLRAVCVWQSLCSQSRKFSSVYKVGLVATSMHCHMTAAQPAQEPEGLPTVCCLGRLFYSRPSNTDSVISWPICMGHSLLIRQFRPHSRARPCNEHTNCRSSVTTEPTKHLLTLSLDLRLMFYVPPGSVRSSDARE